MRCLATRLTEREKPHPINKVRIHGGFTGGLLLAFVATVPRLLCTPFRAKRPWPIEASSLAIVSSWPDVDIAT
jgi:hypothetical protein